MSVSDLKKSLSNLKKTSIQILTKIHPIMKKIENKDKEFFLRGVLLKHCTQTEEQICESLEIFTSKILNTPLTVLNEIDLFSNYVISEEEKLEKSTPFLYLVWQGDYFGEPKVKGLTMLISELKQIEEKISEEIILNSI